MAQDLVADFDVVDAGATASTTPAASRPSTTGYSWGSIWAIMPAAMPLSKGLRPAALTRIRTVPSVTVGVGRSPSSGWAPAAGMCSARIVLLLFFNVG